MTLIIGYGNPLRTDDGIGIVIAEAIGGIGLQQLKPELAEPISRAKHLVLIDARFGETLGHHERNVTTELPQRLQHQAVGLFQFQGKGPLVNDVDGIGKIH